MNGLDNHAGSFNGSNVIGKTPLRDIDFFNDISGTNGAGHSKATINLRWYEKNSDGTETEIREMVVQKPVVHIIKRPGYVNVFLDFSRRIDVDLNNAWTLISDYFSPLNSVSYTDEELESGIFNANDGRGDRMVYYPLLEVRMSPTGRETDYIIIGLNPVCANVTPKAVDGEPCVIQLAFDEAFFVVNSDLEPIDIEDIRRELIEEIQSGEFKDYMH